jgi:hypothetical protein
LSARIVARVVRPLERDPRGGIERQQVHLALDAVEQPHQAAGVLGRVVCLAVDLGGGQVTGQLIL